MKYIVILCDGMADEPLESLSGKTPLEAAKTTEYGSSGKKRGDRDGSDSSERNVSGKRTANLSVIGYDPKKYYSGRSPLRSFEYRRADGGLGCVFSVQPCYIDRG